MQKITPFLWFDNNAEEAIRFYTSIFPESSASAQNGSFQLAGQYFMTLNGGPMFKFTPAGSFFVSCTTEDEIDGIWKAFSEGGMAMMPLDKYPFSAKFGWIQDKFGLSWQLNLTSGAEPAQKISPFLMFVGEQHGRAEEAINFYISQFDHSGINYVARYEAGEPGQEGTVKHASFNLNGQQFMAMESNGPHNFSFNEAFSLFVSCETQPEIDAFWEKLSAGGKKSRCGWLKDKFGVSWQVVPPILGKLLGDPDPVKRQRVMQAMMKMDKIVIQDLQTAYAGE